MTRICRCSNWVLTFYNVIFVFPLFVLLGIYLLLGDRAADLLDRINLDH